MSAESLALIDRIAHLSKQPKFTNDVDAQHQVAQLSRELSMKLIAPEEAANELAYYPIYAFAARIAIDMKLFKLIAASQSSISAANLANATGSSEELIVRVLRVISALGFVQEVGENQWTANSITHTMCRPEMQAAHIHKWDNCNGTMIKMPSYFKTNGYSTPKDPSNGPFQFAFNTNKNAFDYWHQNPSVAANFNTFMKGKRASRPSWADWWPVESLIFRAMELDTNRCLLVDVGGGRGHDVQSFKDKFPNRGRLVVEDLPAVIDDIKELDNDIERVKYDFFTPQPVEGARIYFFGMIFHDWSDEFCLKILSQTVPAMKKGYSKLLIDDAFLPTQGCPAVLGALDLAMMAMHAGKERTESQWKALLEKAGLTVNRFWSYKGGAAGIIEAELK
ncbi:sterigmatocystin 8-O-methyltransferase [Lojkania enalia]|uniref:Sterigmatocystin 8-O-methyltransferase n=1 Tax=Lojkania enalia TaxID=147567 RepID=A0A9P4K4G8_9PLEO|nr:sterigmatocystin 8-O-methyltransferase [Didymosphaeria enalia]